MAVVAGYSDGGIALMKDKNHRHTVLRHRPQSTLNVVLAAIDGIHGF
jgi:hypothetical protein